MSCITYVFMFCYNIFKKISSSYFISSIHLLLLLHFLSQMDIGNHNIALENGLDLRKLCTTGSILHINTDYDEQECYTASEAGVQKWKEYIGEPVESFDAFEKDLLPVDPHSLVRKKILEAGGGLELNKECTVCVAYAGYWENDLEPFDFTKSDKPLVVNLNDNGLLPGVQMALESMLVGEMSVFLLSYEVMYGEMGVPPKIKPKANCVFYLKLIKSILTSKDGKIDYSEPNMFERIHHEVKLLYSSGVVLHKSRNYMTAIQSFRKGVNMLHRCRLADEKEEVIQEKLLKKLYTNLAVCYNEVKQPLKTCIVCNELNRLRSLWNNEKVLYQNAKALRMIGQFDAAEKKLRRALKLSPNNEKIGEELSLLLNTKDSCNKTRLIDSSMIDSTNNANEHFKSEVDSLIKSFKENVNLCKLTLPPGLNTAEIEYIKEACVRENLYCNKMQKDYLLDKNEDKVPLESNIDLFI